jgi:hypothetical protein
MYAIYSWNRKIFNSQAPLKPLTPTDEMEEMTGSYSNPEDYLALKTGNSHFITHDICLLCLLNFLTGCLYNLVSAQYLFIPLNDYHATGTKCILTYTKSRFQVPY